MNIPARLSIGPYSYQVRVQDDVRSYSDRNQPLYGNISFTKHLIEIDAAAPDDRKPVIFWHEVLHGLDELVGAGLTEKQVARLAPALTHVLIENHLLRELGADEGVG